ncbi:MAG: ferritin-like domain-containing protein [Elusimicrobia bacterium]|nr:ferritin-like domain-containing protein [Elusimicrobiota bacterium]
MKTVSRTMSFFGMIAAGAAAVIVLAGIAGAAEQQPAAAPAAPVATTAMTPASTTLANLLDAFNRESNVREYYLACAKTADKEKYLKVAELFRGAAKSEEVHIKFYAKNITKLGGTPTADIKTPMVKTTGENLAATITEINNETMTLYPQYLAQAQAAAVPEGTRAFGSAIKIRGNQKIIFETAASNLASWKQSAGGFYVCTVCGQLEQKLDFAKCVVCGASLNEFVQVK